MHMRKQTSKMSLENGVREQRRLESAFERHRSDVNIDDARNACETARDQWDSVATVETAFRNSIEARRCLKPQINVQQALVYFQRRDMSAELRDVRSSEEPRGLCTLLSCLLGPPELYDYLTTERDLVFAIAQCKLDMSEPVHMRMLQTVYQRLTGAHIECPSYGAHWEHIGFQGTDPGTDLRGVGMLGLLQLLYLSNSPHLIPLARDIYRVSMDENQNFPLAVMSLNMTRIALVALRHGELNRECNHCHLVVDVVNQFYAAVFYHTLHIWMTQHKTIRDSGYVLKDVELYCRGNVRTVLRDLHEHLGSYSSSRSHTKPCLPGSFQDLLIQAKTEVFIYLVDMIKSVKERKENSFKFSLCYEDICKLQNRVPLPCVKAHLKKNILDFNSDRITYDEWGPILNALSLDRSLHFIGIRSTRCGKSVLADVSTESKARALEHSPLIQTHFVLLLLMKSLRMCMTNTQALTCMELEGLPMSSQYLEELIEGVKNCVSLQNISLHCSPIGDKGCEMICQAIKSVTNIVSVDMSSCGLSHQGALAIADVIKHQKIQRYSETWKHTLRYREPDLDSLPGLRRITLNHNTNIQDQGLLHLVDVTKDDLFLKALDMQNCGIGNVGGTAVLEMLKSNVSLTIVDLRANEDMDTELLKEIMQQLHVNNQGCTEEYHWIAVDRFQLSHQPRRAHRSLSSKSAPVIQGRITNSNIPISADAFNPNRSKSIAPLKGVPWRISERLVRRKEHASICPGTPRAVQLQETQPPFYHSMKMSDETPQHRIQLERARQQILWISEQLSLEIAKRRKLEEENEMMRRQIKEFPGKDLKLVNSNTMAEMERSLSDFQLLTRKLRDLGLNPDVLLSQNIVMHKSHSEHVTNTFVTDIHRTSKSACAVGNYSAVHVETRMGDMREVSCSSDSDDEIQDESQEKDINTIMYATVQRKNRELQYFTEDEVY